MHRDNISPTQLRAMLCLGVLAPVAELLPALTLPTAGKAAWLSPLAALVLLVPCAWLLANLAGRQGMAASLHSSFGTVAGSALILLYIMWAEVLLAFRLRLCAQRLLTAGQRDGEVWFFLVAMSALVFWMGRGKLAAFARAGQIFMAMVLLAGGAVLALSLLQVKVEWVLPLYTQDIKPVLQSAVGAAGVLMWGLWGAFLAGQVQHKNEGGHGKAWFYLLVSCLLLGAAQWIILGNLSPALAARVENPFFALAKSVGVEGAFQRVESVISAIWSLADLCMAAVLVFSIRIMLMQLFARMKKEYASAIGLLVAVAAAFVFGEYAAVFNEAIIPMGNLMFALVIPTLLVAIKAILKRGGT